MATTASKLSITQLPPEILQMIFNLVAEGDTVSVVLSRAGFLQVPHDRQVMRLIHPKLRPYALGAMNQTHVVDVRKVSHITPSRLLKIYRHLQPNHSLLRSFFSIQTPVGNIQ